LAEHYVYEIKMLRTTYQLLSRAAERGLANALMEAFSLHARVLIDFFDSDPRLDDAIAAHFTKDGTFAAPAVTSILWSVRQRLNKQIVHLTYSRTGAHKIDGADRLKLLRAIEADHAEFKRQVAPEFSGCFSNEQPFGVVVSRIKASAPP
jgi:hypothetical protein